MTNFTVLNILLFAFQSPKNSEQVSDCSKKEMGKTYQSVTGISEVTQSSSSTTAINEVVDSLKMHVTVINLLTWIVLLTSPSLIYWLKNLR